MSNKERVPGFVKGLEERVKVASPCTGCAAGPFFVPSKRVQAPA